MSRNMARRPAMAFRAVLLAGLMCSLPAAGAGAAGDNSAKPELPPAPTYGGARDPQADTPLPCRPSKADDVAGRLQCIEEQLARMQSQLDRMEQIEDRLIRRLVDEDGRR